jgi:hypothetical protein
MALAFDVAGDAFDGIEILRHQFVVLDLDTEGLLQEPDNLHDAGGVDDPCLQQGCLWIEAVTGSQEKVLNNKRSNLPSGIHFNLSLAPMTRAATLAGDSLP